MKLGTGVNALNPRPQRLAAVWQSEAEPIDITRF